MIWNSIKTVCAFAAMAFVLAACADMRGPDPSEIAAASVFDQRDMRLVIVGANANAALDSEAGVRDALSFFGVPEPPTDNMRQWINDIRDARGGSASNPNSLSGLSGYGEDAFLNSAMATLSNGNIFARPIKVSVRGQIMETADCEFGPPIGNVCNDPNATSEPGFRFEGTPGDETDKSGYIWVTVFYTYTNANTGVVIPGLERAYRWKIRVNNGFSVAQKDPDLSNPSDVFPDAEPLHIPWDMAINFEYKLWAFGNTIEVLAVLKRTGASGPFTQLNPNNHPYYQTDEDSCIDMMFAEFPPQQLSPGMVPPAYCLGRCVSPPIVNTI